MTRSSSLVSAILTVLLWIAPAAAQDWELVWSDEFEGTSIDSSKWMHEVNARGGGNNELQFYTDRPENSRVEDGLLVIEARDETYTGDDGTRSYTSARLRTKRMGDWTYGRFEVRARMPEGQGLWPAVWLLSTDREYGVWAASGEIDIVEMVGQKTDEVFGSIHYGRPWPQNVNVGRPFVLPEGSFSESFHTFAIEWEPEVIRWFVDDSLYQERTDWFSSGGDYPAPFNRRFYLILNLAVGGDLPGSPDASTPFPQTLDVDFVRVYQLIEKYPSVEITQPADGTVFDVGSTVVISAEASDPDGEVATVIFEQGEAELARISEPPYEYSIESAQAGCYSITVRAMDDEGRVAEDGPLSFQVGSDCVLGPYLVAAARVPGRIEAEHFDLGGPGVAYSDVETRNIGLEMRPREGVDIEYTSDVGRGHNIGWIEPDEWLIYTIDVEEAGQYEITARVASEQTGGSLSVETGGGSVSGRFGASGGWQNWTTVSLGSLNLVAGVQTLRVVLESSGFNLNWINLERVGDPTAAASEIPSEAGISVETYPNPFLSSPRIRVTSEANDIVRLTLVDILGRQISSLFDGQMPSSGQIVLQPDLADLSSGVYLLRVEAGDQIVDSILMKAVH